MSETYCKLPFVHFYTEPKGEVKPCCIAGGFDEPLNLKDNTIEEAFNSSQMKQLRKDMLDGKRNKVCDVCYKREDATGHSPRLQFNENPLWKHPTVNEDYSVVSNFKHIDIRFSNLCNFKCRMCNHTFSSHWYNDSKKLNTIGSNDKKVLKASDTIVEDLIPHLSEVKSFYFAGGEPLIMPEHYKVLKYLHDTFPKKEFYISDKENLNAIDIAIHYNTNLSVIKYDEKSLIDIWKSFKQIFLSISCDGIGKVGEYQRTGFNTDKFEQNLKIIKKYFRPVNLQKSEGYGLKYNFQYTTTIMNVYHIFDFIDYMLKNNHITESGQIDFYYAWSPIEFALSQIPKSEKNKIETFLNKNKSKYSEKTQDELNSMIQFMNSNMKTINKEFENDDRLNKIREIEKLHGGRFEDISPIKITN